MEQVFPVPRFCGLDRLESTSGEMRQRCERRKLCVGERRSDPGDVSVARAKKVWTAGTRRESGSDGILRHLIREHGGILRHENDFLQHDGNLGLGQGTRAPCRGPRGSYGLIIRRETDPEVCAIVSYSFLLVCMSAGQKVRFNGADCLTFRMLFTLHILHVVDVSDVSEVSDVSDVSETSESRCPFTLEFRHEAGRTGYPLLRSNDLLKCSTLFSQLQ